MEFRKALTADKAYPILFAIALIALAFRITTLRFDNLLLGGDPWYHYKIAKILLETGEYPMWEYYTRYPYGEPVIAPPGFYYLPVMLYKLAALTGISFFRVFQLLPAIIGVLSIIPFYLLIKELFNRKTGLIAALLLAISPAGITRALAGYYRGEVFLVFTMLFALYLFVMSLRKKLYFSVLAGVFLFLGGLFWNGWPFALGVLSAVAGLTAIFNYLKNLPLGKLAMSYGIASALGLSLIYIVRETFYKYEAGIKEIGPVILGFKLVVAFLLLLVLLEGLRTVMAKNRNARVFFLSVSFLVLLLYTYKSGYIKPLEGYYQYLENVRGIALTEVPTHIWRLGISEQRSVTLPYLSQVYSILLILAPIGLLLTLKKGLSQRSAFALAFTFSTVPLLVFQIRFAFIAAPALCLLSALPLDKALRRCGFKGNSKRVILLTAVILMLFSVNLHAANRYVSEARPFVSQDLYEALDWMSENTPEDSIVLAWWDYSGPIAAIADRRVVTHTAPSGIVESFALLLRTSNESQALEIFKSLNEDFSLRDMKADYLIADTRTYLLWPKILKFSPWVNSPLKVENKDVYQSMLHKMFVNNVSEFELVYSNGEVRIYKPNYKYTRIIEVDVERYQRREESISIKVKTRSNEDDKAVLKVEVRDPKGEVIFTEESNVGREALKEVKFNLPEGAQKGAYKATAVVSPYKNSGKHSMYRNFWVID